MSIHPGPLEELDAGQGREAPATPDRTAAASALSTEQTSFVPAFERAPQQGWQPSDIPLADRHRGQALQDRYVNSLLQQQVYSSEAKKYYDQRDKRDPHRKTQLPENQLFQHEHRFYAPIT